MEPATLRLRFTPRVVPLVVVVTFVSLVATLSVGAHVFLLGPDTAAYPRHVSALLSLPFSVLMLVGTWAALRYEGITAAGIGLGRDTLLPAVVTFGIFWGLVTVGGAAYLTLTGATGEFGFAFEMPWYWVPVWFLLMLTLSNGLTEEFIFRGYLQSKCTALWESYDRVPSTAFGVLSGAVLFGVPHLPLGVILEGASLGAVPWIVLSNLVPGIAYGLLYYLTQNVWYTGFVHGFGNATLVPFDPSAVPLFTPAATTVGIVLGLGYRYWARQSHRVTVRVHKELTSSAH